jgi:hypothetical protein
MSNPFRPEDLKFDTDGELLLPCVVVDPDAYYPPFDEMSLATKPSGKTIILSTPSGKDDGSVFAEKFGLNKQPDDVNWEAVEFSIAEPKQNDVIIIDPSGDLSETDEAAIRVALRSERVLVYTGDCMSSRTMSKLALMGAAVLGISNTSALGLSASIAKSMEAFSFTTFPEEFRFSDLHYRLSHEATMLKDKRQQQSRKAHFLLHEKKRVARGRSHAKQKHKGMQRFV